MNSTRLHCNINATRVIALSAWELGAMSKTIEKNYLGNINFPMFILSCRYWPMSNICLSKIHNTFSTTVHHKKTSTGLYTKWDSFTPRLSIRSISVIRTLTYLAVQNPLYCSRFYLISKIPCFKMVIREVSLTTTLLMYWTNIRTVLENLLSQFPRKM